MLPSGVPLTYRIDSAAGMLFVTGSGIISQDERMGTMKAWMSDPAFRPGMNTLCDFSESLSAPTLTELQELIGFIRQHAAAIGRKKLALITSRPLTFGAARQFEVLADGAPLDIQVFSTREAAWHWLTGQSSDARWEGAS